MKTRERTRNRDDRPLFLGKDYNTIPLTGSENEEKLTLTLSLKEYRDRFIIL